MLPGFIEWVVQHPVLFWSCWVATVAGMWKAFEKAGHPGWAVLVPFYNLYVLGRIASAPWWTLVGFLIPVLNVFIALALSLRTAKNFGKSPLFGLGLFFVPPVFWPMLGFGRARHRLIA